MLKLPRKAVTSAYVQPVRLPRECNDNLENIDGIAVGTGLASIDGTFDSLLRHTHIRTMPFDECRYRLSNRIKVDSILCAEPNSGQAVFRGDSGMKEIIAYV